MRVEFHPATADEVNEAAAFYASARPGLDLEFRREIAAVIARIAANPLQSPIVEAPIRRCIVHRFPYSVLFRVVNPELVRVLAVRHHRRHPRLGLTRS